jgi:lipid-A-disaccharide synthase
VRTVHLVAPQIWAHTPWRILRWRRAVDLLLASFPFEPALFEGAGMRTVFVGHPLFEAPLPAARTPPERPRGRARVELWPGSRRREVGRLAPLLLEAAALLQAEEPGLAFVVRLARPEHEALFGQAGRTARWRPASLSFACREEAGGPPLLGALAASGTASAELAVGLVPLAVIYRIGLFEWCLGRLLVTAPWIALPNLVLGREAVPERLVWAPDAGEALAADFRAVAGDGTRWRATRARLAEVRQRLETPGVAERAARWVEAELNRT